MSLFEGLFGGGGAKKASSLFKESSKYKRSNNEFVEEAQEGVKSRKRKRERKESTTQEGAGSKIQDEDYDEKGGQEGYDEMDSRIGVNLDEADALRTKSEGSQQKLTKAQIQERDSVEAEKLERTIFVGNLLNTPKLRKKLKVLFSQFGPVESTRVRSAGVSEGSKLPKKIACAKGAIGAQGSCNGYVVFKDKDTVKAALKMNMKMFEGRHLRVDRSTPQRHKSSIPQGVVFDESTSVFIHNLVPEVSDEDIIKFFTSQRGALGVKGKVEAVRLIRDQRLRLCKGIGYVKFNSRKAVAAALELDGTEFMGRRLKVNRVKKMKDRKGDQFKMKRESAAWEGVRTKGPNKIIKSKAGSQGKGGSKRKN